MKKTMKALKVGLVAGLITLIGSPAFARSINVKETGTIFWIFIILGAAVVMLQLVPAAILFFSFIGKMATMTLRKEQKAEEVILPGAEPIALKK